MTAYLLPLRIVLLLAICIGPSVVNAQGLRVSTHVYDVTAEAKTGRPAAVSGSLSLFHHGKVYDYVDSAEEVVILDLSNRKFTILNIARQLTTTLSFDEMRHLLNSRGPAAEKYIEDLLRTQRPEGRQVADFLRFQMKPSFDRSYESATGTLTLTAPSWTYKVTTTAWDDADTIDQYLVYADRMAMLNHLLHPGALFPEPRMELNAALKELSRLPLTVQLDLRPTERMHLRAEHRFTRGLQDDDHRRVARWEAALASESLQQMTFRGYQQAVLLASSR
jgi:hypothetical protein